MKQERQLGGLPRQGRAGMRKPDFGASSSSRRVPATDRCQHGSRPSAQMAEVAVPRQTFADILPLIAGLRAPPAPA